MTRATPAVLLFIGESSVSGQGDPATPFKDDRLDGVYRAIDLLRSRPRFVDGRSDQLCEFFGQFDGR
jgi:hypothetical protein